jgi:hypothetical protein
MEATKYTVTVTIECLSMDSVPALLRQVIEGVDTEAPTGAIFHDDGDQVEWITGKEEVDF